MPRLASEPGIEVSGTTVYAIVEGFGEWKTLARKLLLEEGIGQDDFGEILIDKDGWYSHDAFLRVFDVIGEDVGDAVLFDIGLATPKNARFPEEQATDVETAIRQVDVAYHLNRRKDGRPMYDEVTGKMVDGIGHYGFQKVAGQNMIICVCDNPYPCSFDRGVLTTVAKKHSYSAAVLHDDSKVCRRSGGKSCSFIVTWR